MARQKTTRLKTGRMSVTAQLANTVILNVDTNALKELTRANKVANAAHRIQCRSCAALTALTASTALTALTD